MGRLTHSRWKGGQAQEEHGYDRALNTHLFGYTPETARALAELAGLVDVTIETYKDNPDLRYNLLIRGTKPTDADIVSAVAEDSEPECCEKDNGQAGLSLEVPADLPPSRLIVDL